MRLRVNGDTVLLLRPDETLVRQGLPLLTASESIKVDVGSPKELDDLLDVLDLPETVILDDRAEDLVNAKTKADRLTALAKFQKALEEFRIKIARFNDESADLRTCTMSVEIEVLPD